MAASARTMPRLTGDLRMDDDNTHLSQDDPAITLLRSLWVEGIASGSAGELDIDVLIERARIAKFGR